MIVVIALLALGVAGYVFSAIARNMACEVNLRPIPVDPYEDCPKVRYPREHEQNEHGLYTCPVCDFDKLPEPPENYDICPQCGTEFENDDFYYTHAELRQQWIDGGRKWWSDVRPQSLFCETQSEEVQDEWSN